LGKDANEGKINDIHINQYIVFLYMVVQLISQGIGRKKSSSTFS